MPYPFRQSLEERATQQAELRVLSSDEESALRDRHASLITWAGRLAARTRDARVEHPSTHPGTGGGPAEYFDSHCGVPVPAIDEQGPHRFTERGRDYIGYLQLVSTFLRGESSPVEYGLRLFGVEPGYKVGDGPDTSFRPQVEEWTLPVSLREGSLLVADQTRVATFEGCLGGLERAMNHAPDA